MKSRDERTFTLLMGSLMLAFILCYVWFAGWEHCRLRCEAQFEAPPVTGARECFCVLADGSHRRPR